MRFERIRDLREDRDLNQTAIANYLATDQPGYSCYERGIRDIPIEILMKLADFYETSVDYLIGRTDVYRPYPKSHLL